MDSVSEYSMSHVSDRSASSSAAVDPITAVAGSPSGHIYCYGTQKGVVSLHDTRQGKLATLYSSRAKFAIEHITWSHDGKHICVSDFSKQLVVFTASNHSADANPNYEQTASIPMRKFTKSHITQLLFHTSSSHIMVHTSSQIHTIPLTSCSVENSKDLSSAISYWTLHPVNSELLVGFGAHKITLLDWDLVDQGKLDIQWPQAPGTETGQTSTPFQVDRVLSSQDKNRLLLQVSTAGVSSRISELFFLSTPDLVSSDRSEEQTVTSSSAINLHRMLPELYHDVSLALALLWGDRLIYVSRDFAICSKQLHWTSESTPSSRTAQPRNQRNVRSRALARGGAPMERPNSGVKELFAFPGDWANDQALGLCSLWGIETSLLYPRNGEVAVVRCTALSRG